jgi:hypothetical protein
MATVFLGGTCNNSTWRQQIIPMLNVDYFDPVVPDWNDEAYQRELWERANSTYVLYVITSEMTGVYSIAEAVDDSNKRPEQTIFCVLPEGFSEAQVKSLKATMNLIQNNGGAVFFHLEAVALYINDRCGALQGGSLWNRS